MNNTECMNNRVAANESMHKAQDIKTTRRTRLQQPQGTYKIGSAADIPVGNVLIENGCVIKHKILVRVGGVTAMFLLMTIGAVGK